MSEGRQEGRRGARGEKERRTINPGHVLLTKKTVPMDTAGIAKNLQRKRVAMMRLATGEEGFE